LPRKPAWRHKAEQKGKEFVSLLVTAFVVLLFGLVDQRFFIVFALLAFSVLFVGTLAILGLTSD
jgi:hypothetical protein